MSCQCGYKLRHVYDNPPTQEDPKPVPKVAERPKVKVIIRPKKDNKEINNENLEGT